MDLKSSEKPMIPEDEIPLLSNWTCRIIERRNLTILNSQATIFRHKLYDCDIVDSSIDDCELYNCRVQNAKNLFNVQFHNCEIINSKAADVKFHNCRIQDAKKVFNAEFHACEIVNSKVVNAKLYTCKIQDAKKIFNAQFHNCEISNSKMINAKLYNCLRIEGCHVTRAILENSVSLNSTFGNDSDFSIWKLYIRNCQIDNCRIEQGRIVRSKLEKGHLDRCEVETTTMTGTKVQTCDLLWCALSKGTSIQSSLLRDGSISQSGDITWDIDTQISKAAVGFEKFPLEIVQEIFQYALKGKGKKIPLLDAVRGHKVFHEVALKALGSFRKKPSDSETKFTPRFHTGDYNYTKAILDKNFPKRALRTLNFTNPFSGIGSAVDYTLKNAHQLFQSPANPEHHSLQELSLGNTYNDSHVLALFH